MKFCKDCKYYMRGGACVREGWERIDPVTGSRGYAGLNDAYDERLWDHKCGPNAQFFEPATRWTKIKRMFL